MAKEIIWYRNNKEFYKSEQEIIKAKYKELHYRRFIDRLKLIGYLTFSAKAGEFEEIKDGYSIEIIFPNDYPNSLPSVRSTDGRIPLVFHTNPDNTLCLGTYIEQYLIFEQKKNIENFIDSILIPFLYNFSYKEKHKRLPLEERDHGSAGIEEYYFQRYGIRGKNIVENFLRYAFSKTSYRGHNLCPCGSGKRVRDCHKDLITKLLNVPKAILKMENDAMLNK